MNNDNRMERGLSVRRVGGGLHPLSDFYHTLMRASWPTTFGIVFGAFLAINALYALVYMSLGAGVEGMRGGSFEDAFDFSVQTLATIGYGKMAPVSRVAHLVVMMEAFTGMLFAALTTGLVFAKFSRPTARVVFSRVALITPYEGVPTLQFRMANARGNRIVQASIRVTTSRNVRTAEGETMRRLLDLKMLRSDSAMFAITWTAYHPLTEDSPLFGATPESIQRDRVGLVVTLIGLDETISQTVHARHSYDHDQIVFGGRFVDVLSENADGSRTLDLGKFHDFVPTDGEKVAPQTGS